MASLQRARPRPQHVIDKSGIGNQVTGRGGPNQVTDVGVASRVTDRGVARAVNQNDLYSFHAEYGFKLSLQIDDAQHYQILEMLHRYKSVFARDMTEIKLSTGEPMKLELHSNHKMLKRQYRLSEPDKNSNSKFIRNCGQRPNSKTIRHNTDYKIRLRDLKNS